jgi:hypothetical protein
MTAGIGGRPSRRAQWIRERLAYYEDVALFGLGACLIIGAASQFEQWLSERRVVHLEFSIGLLLVTFAFFALIPNRTFVVIGALALVVLLGVVGTIVNQTLVLIPLTLGCAVVAYLLIRYKGGTIKPQ